MRRFTWVSMSSIASRAVKKGAPLYLSFTPTHLWLWQSKLNQRYTFEWVGFAAEMRLAGLTAERSGRSSNAGRWPGLARAWCLRDAVSTRWFARAEPALDSLSRWDCTLTHACKYPCIRIWKKLRNRFWLSWNIHTWVRKNFWKKIREKKLFSFFLKSLLEIAEQIPGRKKTYKRWQIDKTLKKLIRFAKNNKYTLIVTNFLLFSRNAWWASSLAEMFVTTPSSGILKKNENGVSL